MSYKKPSDTELKTKLTPLQYQCTQEGATERPFENQYWNHHEDGIYVDVVTGEPLFSSLDKFDSGSGWPSFSSALSEQGLKLKDDFEIGVKRTEVRSAQGDSHLGHLFNDGPTPTGKRYCINSAAMNFIPVSKLEEHGLGKYLFLFAAKAKWQIATLAGGCFWGVEEIFRKTPGVIQTQVGYTGGSKENVTYEDVKSGKTGHAEAVQILFDPKKLSYEDLLLLFFKLHDPTTLNQQGNDVGTQYRSTIFYANEAQKKVAEAVKSRVVQSGAWERPVVTELVAQSKFWRAEDYHQAYLKNKPGGYTCHFVRKKKF